MTSDKHIHILLIEDNPGDSRLIKEYLDEPFVQFSSNLTIEQSFAAGGKRLKNEEFDIILLDLSLPDSFGLDTFEEIEKISGDIPIIVLTGLDDEEVGMKAVELGAQDFLIKKELNATLLSRSISYAIQRNQLNRQLEKNEERLLEAQRLAHLGNFEQDLETGELIWSDELSRIFDRDPKGEEPSFDGLLDMIHPEDRNRTLKAIKKVQQENKQQHLEIRIHTKSGTEKYIHNIINPIKNQDGDVVKIFGTTHDITEQKKAAERLKENERRYHVLFQSATDEILVFQLNHNREPLPFIEANDVACDILGYTRDELLKQTLYDIVDAEKKDIQDRIKQVINDGMTIHESRHLTKEGSLIPLEISARSFIYNGRQTIISVGRDIRERLKLEQEILNISEQERQRIGRDLHDDLGQMLSGIRLITQNLVNSMKSNGLREAEKVQEISDMIKEADEHARSLSRGLVPVNVESNGLDSALQELTDKIKKMQDVDIQFFNKSENLLQDNTFAIHLYRIAQEAINNAIKHGAPTCIKVGLSSDEDYVSLYVEDNGSGFTDPEETSDGMGIRIMHFRAKTMGGKLEVNSKKGEGTKIICKLPLEVGQEVS